MLIGSLFSGIGGIDLAFEQAGFTVAWQVEIDSAANKILAKHWPNVPRFGDIREVEPEDLTPVDVIAFGSPCTDLSVAGKRAGLKGAQSGLFYEAIRIIQGVRPSLAVWENVPGVFYSNGGRDFGAVLAAFRDSGIRECAWRVLDARYFGVAQRRRRIFLVADFAGERATQILFERESVSGDYQPQYTARDIAPTLFASGAGTERTASAGSESYFVIVDVGTGKPRRFTPIETERLQGLPDDWTRWDADGSELSDSARYRLIGNSVAVPVVRWIAERMKEVRYARL